MTHDNLTTDSTHLIVPLQGSIFWYSFPGKGHEQQGRRPYLVVSLQDYNSIGLCVASPVTTVQKKYPFEVEIPKGVCSVHGWILCDHVKTLDWKAWEIVFSEKDMVPPEIMMIVNETRGRMF